MAATTYTWNTITASQTDGDSPLDETLMEGSRQNQVTLREWLGDGYTAAKDHDHDNVNSKTVVLGAGTVTTSRLSSSTGSWTASGTAVDVEIDLVSAWAFVPQTKYNNLTTGTFTVSAGGYQSDSGASFVNTLYASGANPISVGWGAQWNYVT